MKTLSPEIEKAARQLKEQRPEPTPDDFMLSEKEVLEAEAALQTSKRNDWLKLVLIVIGALASIKSFLLFDNIIFALLGALCFSGLSMMLVVVIYGWTTTTKKQKLRDKPLDECSLHERYERFLEAKKTYYTRLYKDAKKLSSGP